MNTQTGRFNCKRSSCGVKGILREFWREYLSGRGVCLQTAIRAGARFCRNWAPSPEGKIYRGGAAILFSLRDFDGELQAVNGRYIALVANLKARTGGTLGAGAFWAAPCDGCNWRKSDALGLVEGPFDALALGGVNLPVWFARAVAFKAVSIGSDSDAAGEVAAAEWTRQISGFTARVSRLCAPDGYKDFGEALETFGRERLTAWLRECAPQLLPAPNS